MYNTFFLSSIRISLLHLLISFYSTALAQKIHSHNDYWRERPFYEAFESGAQSIEVDILLQEGQLFAAHTATEIKKENTLESMYLIPLMHALKKKGNNKWPLQLLIDIKTEALPTLNKLIGILDKYPDLIKRKNRKKLRLVISGNRPPHEQYQHFPKYIFFDHQNIQDIPNDLSRIALISLPFTRYSKWNGSGEFKDRDQIKQFIDKAHHLHKPLRFWGTPDTIQAWDEWITLGLDFINTDKPQECVHYLMKKSIKE